MIMISNIVSDPEILGGNPVVGGTRVPVENVLAAVHAGQSRFEIFRHYPSLPPDAIDACLRWEKLKQPLFESDPEILGGVPVFFGTRVPVAVLFENLAGGLSLDEIVDSYPSVKKEQAIEALRQAGILLQSHPNTLSPTLYEALERMNSTEPRGFTEDERKALDAYSGPIQSGHPKDDMDEEVIPKEESLP